MTAPAHPEDDAAIYLEAAEVALSVLGLDIVAEAWEQPSALRGMLVADLAGHLSRAVLLTERVLDEGPADGTPLSASQYYRAGADHSDFDSPSSQRVRATGANAAACGPAELRTSVNAALARLRDRLPNEDLDERHLLFGRVVTTRTLFQARTIELVVHIDDLAASTGIATPALPAAALDLTISVLVDIARQRHTDLSVVRALSRRERDEVNALRVL